MSKQGESLDECLKIGGKTMSTRVLVIDNYDSFTYNLVQYLGELGAEPLVFRNDAIDIPGIIALDPQRILISPGPGTPDQAGISLDVIQRLGGKIPILGVCLGHQAIGQVLGGKVGRAPLLMHGKTSLVYHSGQSVLAGIANPFEATRYHSLIVERESIPDCLTVTAWTEDGTVMAVRHREFEIDGVQFHPESVMTRPGKKILKNFLC